MTKPATKPPSLLPGSLFIILAVVLLGLLLGLWFVFFYPSSQQQAGGLTQEGKDYVKQLKLSGVEMQAKENFMGGTLVEITGKITNNGSKRVRRVELTCVFTNPEGQPVLRERVAIVRTLQGRGGLPPGETKDFRLPFDAIPPTWNQVMPHLVIAGMEFDN